MARPSKLSPETEERILTLIRTGNTVDLAAEAAGISRATFFAWMVRGEKPGKPNARYREFRARVDQARAESEAALVTRIAKAAASGSWQASAWLLERRFAERWAKQSERIKSDTSEPTTKATAAPTFDELAARRAS